MQNQENKFEALIGYAKSMLGCSYEELKTKYIPYPITLTVHLEDGISEKAIEVYFNKKRAAVSLDFDKGDKCTAAYLLFSSKKDENGFIEYLSETYGFDFRKSCWLFYDCFLKISVFNDITYFYFHKQ